MTNDARMLSRVTRCSHCGWVHAGALPDDWTVRPRDTEPHEFVHPCSDRTTTCPRCSRREAEVSTPASHDAEAWERL